MLKFAASVEDADIHNSHNFGKQKKQEKGWTIFISKIISKMCYSQFQQRNKVSSWRQIKLLLFWPQLIPEKCFSEENGNFFA